MVADLVEPDVGVPGIDPIDLVETHPVKPSDHIKTYPETTRVSGKYGFTSSCA